MKQLESVLQTTIMITALVVLIFGEKNLMGQCWEDCGGSAITTISHNNNAGNPCDNVANGDCSVAIGSNSTINTGANHSFAGGVGAVVNDRISLAFGETPEVNAANSFSLGRSTNTTGELSFALGDNTLAAADASFVYGAGMTNNQPSSFLLGWDGAESFYAEESKVALFTQNTNADADFLVDQGNVVQEYCTGTSGCQSFPSLTGTDTKWSGKGTFDPFFLNPFVDAFGERYQWQQYATNFGMIDRDPNTSGSIKDALIVIDDFNATETSPTSNIMRIGFRWGDPNSPGKHGFDSLVHIYPRGNPDNIFEVYGPAGKPGGGTWNTLSDRRVKQNVKPYDDGLQQLLEINPVRYQYNENAGYATDEEYVGVIAQDMQKVAPYMISDQGKYLTYNSNALIYMLVNAVKEEHMKLKEEKAKRKKLEERVTELEEKFDAVFGAKNANSEASNGNSELNEVTLSNKGIEEPLLYQNTPNPFSGSTEIGYYLPESATNATIVITEVETGQVIKRVNLDGTGSGKLKVNVENLSAGAYSYTLLVDGKQSLTRQMMLQR